MTDRRARWRTRIPIIASLGTLACAGGDAGAGEAEDGATAAGAPAAMETAAGAAAAGTGGGDVATLLDPNDASREELEAVAGMTAEAVAAIEAGRPFARMSDVHAALAGAAGEEAALSMYEALWLPIGLNDATRDEILLIPGVGSRMAREFEEYRPYADIAQFRREIGKYVDEAEVARLERYVTLH